MSLLEQTLTAYIRGVMIAGLILAIPFFIALFKDLINSTKGDN